ncbi:lethal(3)malignant brain tumor, putative [Ixodes scapularis]|uniref:Lethal(3)malignant brain tumor, putative n=1 Tax=Ixodes scapularis TaxID=6945 RepID=B7PTD5_IXOSC|nr:lethal(3)malignant brain tumor, putative [Ixodes scapularis]|eukprot:XP_002404198.1 lethal(3)malignant brain tumor, putative [Ixodes scapularis]
MGSAFRTNQARPWHGATRDVVRTHARRSWCGLGAASSAGALPDIQGVPTDLGGLVAPESVGREKDRMVQTGTPVSSGQTQPAEGAMSAPVEGPPHQPHQGEAPLPGVPQGPLVGPLAGPSGTALINLAFANADLVQRALPLSSQVPPQMTTITLTRDMRTEGQLNPAVQKPIIVTVSGLPGMVPVSKAQGCTGVDNCVQLTPISIGGPGGVMSLATSQTGLTPNKMIGCTVSAGGTLTPVTTTTMLMGKPITVIPASQATFGTLFAPVTTLAGNQSFGTAVLTTQPPPPPMSSVATALLPNNVVTVPTASISMGTVSPAVSTVPATTVAMTTFSTAPVSMTTFPATTVSSATVPTARGAVPAASMVVASTVPTSTVPAPLATVSSVPTPIPVVLPTSVVTVQNAVPQTMTSGTTGGSDADPTQPDFDPIQAMEWKDGIASLPGSNIRVSRALLGARINLLLIWSWHIFRLDGLLRPFALTATVSGNGEVGPAAPAAAAEECPSRDRRSQVIICCQFCNCHGLQSEFVRDGHFCSQLCYVNFASRERIKRKEEHFKHKKRKFTPNGEDAGEEDLHQEQQIIRRLASADGPAEPRRLPVVRAPKAFSWNDYLEKEKATAAPAKLFREHQGVPVTRNGFRAGMKLEAVDPCHPSLFCVVTVAEVVGFRMRLHFDGYSDAFDFWANADSADVFPAGWCERTGHRLQPPKGYSQQEFSWPLYLKACRAQAAPKHLFSNRSVQAVPLGVRVGMKLEAHDRKDPQLVCVATLADVAPESGRFLVHFDGWDSAYDYWADPGSPWVHPVHWAKEHGHTLTPPSDHPVGANALPGTCPTPGCTGLGHVKGPMFATHHSAYGCPYSKENLERDGPVPDRLHGTDPGPGAKAPDAEVSTAPPADTKDGLRRCPTPGCNGSGHLNQKYSVHHKASGCPLAERSAQGDDSSQDSVQSTAAPPQAPRGRGRPRKNKVPPTPTSNGPQKVSKVEGAVVAGWSVAQVATFIGSLPGCQATAKIFRDEQIDGEALLLLGQGDLVRTLRLKLGPALKVYSCILRFRATSSPD